jgi:hypothetical protein
VSRGSVFRLVSRTFLFAVCLLSFPTVLTPFAGFNMIEAHVQKTVPDQPSPTPSVATSPVPVVATANSNCTLIVPANPLTAQGLATPYELVATDPANGPCDEASFEQAAFVQAAVFDPSTEELSVYEPLVINQGDAPAVEPVVPTIPQGATVALWFGFNGTLLTLQGADADSFQKADCITGLNGDIFGQVSACNAPAFFVGVYKAIAAGQLKIPALGTGLDGQTCPSVRSFTHVDQAQSDNVTTTYLVTANNQLAQNNAANAAALQNATVLINGSDNKLLIAMDTALGCTPYMVPDLSNPGQMGTGNPLNEISASVNQVAPIALVPLGDPMVLIGGEPNPAVGTESRDKMNAYRSTVGQPLDVQSATLPYCQNLLAVGPAKIFLDQPFTSQVPPLVATVGNSLFTFMAARFTVSFGPAAGGGLGPVGCTDLLQVTDPVSVTVDDNGVAITAALSASIPTASSTHFERTGK